MKVRDLIRELEAAGWVLRSTRGSHRQFKHPQKPSVATVAILKAADLEGD